MSRRVYFGALGSILAFTLMFLLGRTFISHKEVIQDLGSVEHLQDEFNVSMQLQVDKSHDSIVDNVLKWIENLFSGHLGNDENLSVPELIAENGFPVEVHHVITEDGYILEMHRIPHGRFNAFNNEVNPRPVVFLQHGFLSSSADWIMNTADKALAYMLADNGYDVFIGNARGNTYSRNHTTLSPSSHEFWEFSFHEMGMYDVPAVIDKILELTQQPDLYYIGHSMGTVMFWVTMIRRPEYRSKIRLMSALAPVAYVEHIKSPVRIFAPLAYEAELAAKLFGDREFLPTDGVVSTLNKLVCEHSTLGEEICENIVFLIAGFDEDQVNKTMLPIILAHTPAGASTHTLLHFAQGITSKKFQQFDYGECENRRKYGQPTPPEYDLTQVNVPVALYWADNDWLAPKSDVFHLAPQLQNVVLNYEIPYPKFTHLDFVFAVDSDKLLYSKVISFMKKF